MRREAILHALRNAYIAGYESAPGRPKALEHTGHRAVAHAERLYGLYISPPVPTPSKDENAS